MGKRRERKREVRERRDRKGGRDKREKETKVARMAETVTESRSGGRQSPAQRHAGESQGGGCCELCEGA